LNELRLSILISTYQTGHLISISAPTNNRLTLSFHQFERAMGIAVKPGTIAVCTRKEVWFLRNAPDIAAKLPTAHPHDACFLARTSHFTDDIKAHECAWLDSGSNESEFWIANTLFSCLCSLHPHFSFAPRWRPPFISELRPEDRCHLNGFALDNGRPRFATTLAPTNSPEGWRPVKNNSGCLIEIPATSSPARAPDQSPRSVLRGDPILQSTPNRLLAQNLSLPHSPRMHDGTLYFLHTGLGRLDSINPNTGQITPIAHLPGIARGLAFHQNYAFVGLSKPRPTLQDVPVVSPNAHTPREKLRCGLQIINLKTGAAAAHLEFATGVEEIFDVQLLPGIMSPYISGPSATTDTGQPLWTIPPQNK
jgi:hypothetical protein